MRQISGCIHIATARMTASRALTVVFRGHEYTVNVGTCSNLQTLGHLAQAIEGAVKVPLAGETMKLVVPHRKGALMLASEPPGTSLEQAGALPASCVVHGQADVTPQPG